MPVTLPDYIHIDLSKIDPSKTFSYFLKTRALMERGL